MDGMNYRRGRAFFTLDQCVTRFLGMFDVTIQGGEYLRILRNRDQTRPQWFLENSDRPSSPNSISMSALFNSTRDRSRSPQRPWYRLPTNPRTTSPSYSPVSSPSSSLPSTRSPTPRPNEVRDEINFEQPSSRVLLNLDDGIIVNAPSPVLLNFDEGIIVNEVEVPQNQPEEEEEVPPLQPVQLIPVLPVQRPIIYPLYPQPGCVICQDNDNYPIVTYVKCQHLVVCEQCILVEEHLAPYPKCPLCRTPGPYIVGNTQQNINLENV